MTRSISRRGWMALALATCAVVPLLVSARGQDEGPTDAGLLEKLRYPKTIVLVRHAEKSADDPRDPNLDDAGVARARALARTLEGAGVTHLIDRQRLDRCGGTNGHEGRRSNTTMCSV